MAHCARRPTATTHHPRPGERRQRDGLQQPGLLRGWRNSCVNLKAFPAIINRGDGHLSDRCSGHPEGASPSSVTYRVDLYAGMGPHLTIICPARYWQDHHGPGGDVLVTHHVRGRPDHSNPGSMCPQCKAPRHFT
ncbi:hypothetical protein DPEC_G00303970 [Dallia pectoralis]|uniref:Uncharacterized protein n=1 Tax=Dallia pectoralis TaxID=75939 RepID=A0ACC2FDG8_DALPE|nr:hypothetical protein DPEC_G00303970 [Dallia pectoralis]